MFFLYDIVDYESVIDMNENKKKNILLFSYLLFIFLIMLFYSIKQPFNYGPDEYMRYKIPLYIYNHNNLPLPDNKEVVVEIFNASYAYYPTQLPAIISAFFMKIFSIFSNSENMLVIASRLTGVICGTIFIYFIIKILDELLENKKVKLLGIAISSFIPQFIFLSSYVNNDMPAIMASSIIVYSWILGLKNGFNKKNTLLLTLGLIICFLSYYNSYGWILLSAVIFILSYIKKEKGKISFNYKPCLKYGLIIAITTLSVISYFFIRSYIVNNGDILGINSFLDACEIGAIDSLKPSLRNTPENLGMSYIEMLTTKYYGNSSWIISTIISFIGNFGYCEFKLPVLVYIGYLIVIFIGGFGYLLKLKDIVKNKKEILLHFGLILCLIIPIILSLKYSYSTDYQPQGRYIYPMYTSFVIMISLGYEKIINILNKKIKFKKIDNIIVIPIILFIIGSFVIATKVFINSI